MGVSLQSSLIESGDCDKKAQDFHTTGKAWALT